MVKLPGLPTFWNNLLSPFHSQTGIAPIFIVLLLAGAIIGGTYLVQQPTNILPFAAENDPLIYTTANPCRIEEGSDACDMELRWNSGGTEQVKLTLNQSDKVLLDNDAPPQGQVAISLGEGEDYVAVIKNADGAEIARTTIAVTKNEATDEEETDEERAQAEAEREAEELLYQKCGFTRNENGIPVYAIVFGNNENVNDPECQNLIAKQTEYFNNKIEKARKAAEEEAQRNGLRYAGGIFTVPEDIPEEQKEAAQKKAEELNKTLAQPIKEAEAKQDQCKNLSGQEKSNCLKGTQESIQKVVDETKKAALSGYLAKFNDILSKFGQKSDDKSDRCVKADLGVAPFMDAKRLRAAGGRSENDTSKHRLLLCLGSIGDLKWRVLVGGVATGETDGDGTVNNSGTDDDDECGAKDCGNDAERLWGLYGTESASGGPFWDRYPNGFGINPCVSLHGGGGSGGKLTPESVRADLAKYIAAAESGTTSLPECKKVDVPGDDGVESPCSKHATNCDPTGGGGDGGGTPPSGGDGDDEDEDSEDADEGEGGDEDGGSDDGDADGDGDTDCDCSDEGPDYACRMVDGKKDCYIPDDNKCKNDSDCAGNGDKTECHRSSGQCVKPRQQSTGNNPPIIQP